LRSACKKNWPKKKGGEKKKKKKKERGKRGGRFPFTLRRKRSSAGKKGRSSSINREGHPLERGRKGRGGKEGGCAASSLNLLSGGDEGGGKRGERGEPVFFRLHLTIFAAVGGKGDMGKKRGKEGKKKEGGKETITNFCL